MTNKRYLCIMVEPRLLRSGYALSSEARLAGMLPRRNLPERSYFMAKHLNPLEKEFLIRKFKSNPSIRLSDFCTANNVSDTAFRKWLKQYDEGGIEGLARADQEVGEVLPEGVDRTEEAYKREIIRLRVENERLKKNYTARRNADGRMEYCRLKPKNLK